MHRRCRTYDFTHCISDAYVLKVPILTHPSLEQQSRVPDKSSLMLGYSGQQC